MTLSHRLAAAGAFVALAVAAFPAMAQERGDITTVLESEGTASINMEPLRENRLHPRERAAALGYFAHLGDPGAQRSAVPRLRPRIAERGNLPPGLSQVLDENGRLPESLVVPLPAELAERMPTRTGETERVIVGTAVVLRDSESGEVLDVMEDALDIADFIAVHRESTLVERPRPLEDTPTAAGQAEEEAED